MLPIADAGPPCVFPFAPHDMGPRGPDKSDGDTGANRTAYRNRRPCAANEARLDHYRRLVADVYGRGSLLYRYDAVDPRAGYALFELGGGSNIGVARRSTTCSGKRLLRVPRCPSADESLAQAHMDLHDRGPQVRRPLWAVWHHSLEGPRPKATDLHGRPPRSITSSARAFRLGLHGPPATVARYLGRYNPTCRGWNRWRSVKRRIPVAQGPVDLPTRASTASTTRP